jgi:serine/threonine-protein kinase
VTADGTVKVADFGIAHLPGEGAATLTVTGEIIGSMHYLAPERAKGAPAGQAADVYALGCVLYHLVTGQPPFTAEHPAAVLYQHVDAAPALPSLVRPELGGPFEHALLRMLAKDAADRPSAAEIAAGALRAEPLDDFGRAATVPAAALPAAAVVDAEPGTSALEAPDSPNPGRKMVLLAGATAALATTAAALAVIILNANETERPPTTDIGPQPGVSSSTPAATRTSSTTGPTETGTTTQTTRTTSAPTSQTPSQQTSPSTTPSGTPSTTPTPSSTPSESSTTPSDSPSTSTSSTTPSDTPAPSTPATGSPTPDDRVTATQPGSD